MLNNKEMGDKIIFIMTKKREAKEATSVGRPSKITELVVKKLEEAFAFGCTDLEACLYADISKQCLYNYQERFPEFVDRKEKLKQNPVLKARMAVIQGFADSGELALKFLERKKKDEFSLKQEMEVTIDVTDKLREFLAEE
jgi:hypothetical protein